MKAAFNRLIDRHGYKVILKQLSSGEEYEVTAAQNEYYNQSDIDEANQADADYKIKKDELDSLSFSGHPAKGDKIIDNIQGKIRVIQGVDPYIISGVIVGYKLITRG